MGCAASQYKIGDTARPPVRDGVLLLLQEMPPVTLPDCTLRLCPYTHAALESEVTIPVGPREIPELGMGLCDHISSSVDLRLVNPSPSSLCITRVPSDFYADRPLMIELAVAGLCVDSTMAASVARWLSTHILVNITVDTTGRPRASFTVPVSARPSRGGWIARTLLRPLAWADAASITVVSLSLAGLLLSCDCLPATLRPGYNHAPAPEGAVLKAARAGNVRSLQAALDAGGSTEEVDEVRAEHPFTCRVPSPHIYRTSALQCSAWLDCLLLGRPRRPPRGPSHIVGGRRRRGHSRRG